MIDLNTLIPQYAKNKAEMDNYKKICDQENALIKSIMREMDRSDYEAYGYKATYTVSNRESINEEGLISLFTSAPSFVNVSDQYNIVKNKPYIDFNALEKAIYNGALTTEQLLEIDKEKESKKVETLKVSKIKKKKGGEA